MNIEPLEINKTNNSIEKWAKDMTIHKREKIFYKEQGFFK